MKDKIKIVLLSMLCLSCLTACDKTITMDLSSVSHVKSDMNDSVEIIEEDFKNLYSFQIKMDGELIDLPVTIKDLKNTGWAITTPTPEELKDNEMLEGIKLTKNNLTFEIGVMNTTKNSIAFDDLEVGSLTVKSLDNVNQEILLPMGIQLGLAMMEDVKKVYGEAEDVLELKDEHIILWAYEYDVSEDIYLGFNENTKKLETIMFVYYGKEARELDD